MKTLDEVIDDFEKACDLERRCENCSGCLSHDYGCPNDGAESVPDALFYLKEYQTLQYGYIKAIADLEDNPPLTWSELKFMEGKPVWLEGDLINSHWDLVRGFGYRENFDEIDYENEVVSFYKETWDFSEHELGKTWQAYRRERE